MTKLKKLGMPVDSAEAALAWRMANLNIAQRKVELPLVDAVQATAAAVTDLPAAAPGVGQPPLVDLPTDALVGGRFPFDAGNLPIDAVSVPVDAELPSAVPKDDVPEKAAPEPIRISPFDEARTRREVADANLSELKEAELRGQVIRADAMRSAWAAKVATVRDALLQIPSRLAPVLAAESDLIVVTAKLESELRQALSELSATK